MLPRRSRIPRADFAEILRSRRFKNSPHFTLRIGEAADGARVAVSVSKKISKSAVVRNSVRRRTYAALRGKLSALPAGLYLFVAKVGADKLRGSSLQSELGELLNSK